MIKEKFRHSYSGECAPGSNYKGPVPTTNFSTFSVGDLPMDTKSLRQRIEEKPGQISDKGIYLRPPKSI